MIATVRTHDGRTVETTRGTWSSAVYSFGQMASPCVCRRAPATGRVPRLGTVGGGCLLEIREETLGRYLEPGDEVTLEIERFGRLVTPVVARPV